MTDIPEALPATQSVSVVIPNYNGKQLLQQNLPAVLGSMRDGDELIIVDDASTDRSLDWLTQSFQLKKNPHKIDELIGWHTTKHKKNRIITVLNQTNLRFALTVNKGVKRASNKYLLLLNNDVSPTPNIIPVLLAYFEDATVFGVGCLEIEEQQGDQVLGGKNKLFFARGMFQHSRADDFTSGPTAWVSGGSGMFDRDKWLALGGLDAVYQPAYWEDVDLSQRARNKGWQVLFSAEARVHHNHETTNQDVFGKRRIAQISWNNSLKFTRRHTNFWQKLAFWMWRPYWWWQLRKNLTA